MRRAWQHRVSPRAILLDELIELVDDHVKTVCATQEADAAKRHREEEASVTARRLAMETLGEDQDRSPQNKRLKRDEMLKETLLVLKDKAERRLVSSWRWSGSLTKRTCSL
ncbi:hypothetical protein PC121_g5155 [Phytophthora cactorum]|nr:hypothetical protein PC120_g24266 [Phytophthora cactorum]KAG3085653.1 hypothetical protein PC121_g5155 [Phytophthora cactorum]KAG4047822.1 hypothetical protein PC123_g16830 [Phytophthora cactorum]